MKTTNRRDFLKTCTMAACFCGFNSIFKLSAATAAIPGMRTVGSESTPMSSKIEAMGSGTATMESGSSTDSAETDIVASEAEKNERFALHWITQLLDSLAGTELTDAQLRAVVKSTSLAHHDLLNVPEMVKPYIGKPKEFIGFLENVWGWKVTDNKSDHTLIVDENKPFCVCPLLKHASGKLYPALCYCSEGFAERMFSYVYGHPVSVTVASSVQRGDPSCIYHIDYSL